MDRTGWTVQELRAQPAHIIDELLLLWHLQNVAEEAASNGK